MSKIKRPEWIDWVIRLFGLFLIICWFFFYRTPVTFADGNLFYRMGYIAEDLAILLVLGKIMLFNCKKMKKDVKNE